MQNEKKDLLIQEINQNAPIGHNIIKLHTQSHGSIVTRVQCSCGDFHQIYNNSKVIWVNQNRRPDDYDQRHVSFVQDSGF